MSLEFAIRGKAGALNVEVSGALPAWGITVLFGPSGTGKSTLLRMLAGLQPCQGVIRYGEHRWQDEHGTHHLPVWQRPLGMLLQQPTLLHHLTVQGNLDYVIKRRGADVDLDAVVERTRIRHLLGRSVRRLSGGEAQRVALARALIGSPRLLFLDEPLSAVDLGHRESLLAMIKDLSSSMPVLYVTHSLDELLLLADQVWLMEAGKVIAQLPVTAALTSLSGPLAQRSDASSLLAGVCGSFDPFDHLQIVNFGSVTFQVPVAEPEEEGHKVRLRIAARDVSLCRIEPSQSSILNIMPAKVLELMPLGAGQHLVKLDVGAGVVLARLSSRSVRELSLAPGESVFAQIKAVALV